MEPFGIVFAAVAAILVAAVVYGFFEQFKLQVRELELSFPNLPPAFDGYTILHISDTHVTQLGSLERRLIEIISAREVDLCLVTGDMTAEPRASDIFRRLCSVIRSRDSIYSVIGNSEHKPWLDTPTLLEALTFEGMTILLNSSTTIRRGADEIKLVGVDDAYSGHDDVEAAFAGVDPDSFIIFMTHCPSRTPEGIERGADLILAGHTHGGQVRLPGLGVIWTHMRSRKRLNDGLYTSDRLSRIVKQDVGSSALFVNRGAGTSKLHIRILCPPEIAYITLRRSSP